MKVRIARQTSDLAGLASFYRDNLGLPEIGRFEDHAGFDGILIDLPGTGAHLELVMAPEGDPPSPHPETLLVLYLGSWAEVQRLLARSDCRAVTPANPYWEHHGVTIEDPDGWRIVLCAEPGPGS